MHHKTVGVENSFSSLNYQLLAAGKYTQMEAPPPSVTDIEPAAGQHANRKSSYGIVPMRFTDFRQCEDPGPGLRDFSERKTSNLQIANQYFFRTNCRHWLTVCLRNFASSYARVLFTGKLSKARKRKSLPLEQPKTKKKGWLVSHSLWCGIRSDEKSSSGSSHFVRFVFGLENWRTRSFPDRVASNESISIVFPKLKAIITLLCTWVCFPGGWDNALGSIGWSPGGFSWLAG